MQLCPRCGEENPERFRLCGFCGAPLTQAAATAEARKTVTVVFCDLKGSTELGERVDAETLRELLGRYFESMRDILQRHGGTVEKYIGDAIMAVFGLPRLHEDDALRAVRAATEMRSALAELNAELDRRWGVRLTSRIGVNTGEVVAGDVVAGQRFATGDVVNVAARLEQAAPANEVLIGVATYRLVRETVDVEEVEALTLKGKSEPIPAYRLVAVRDTEWFSRRLEAPFVGREDELGELLVAFERATAARRLEVTTVLGHAGLGKTRLIAEFVGRVDTSAAILRGRCLSYGTGMTFWPIAEMVRGASGVTSSDTPALARAKIAELIGEPAADVADRIAAAIGLSDTTFPLQETFWAVRKLIEILAARRPLVLIFDDIHWAEPTLLDLIEHVALTTGEAPALILCGARHDLFDDRAEWLDKRKNASRIVLQALSAQDSARIVENLLGSAGLPVAARDRIIAAADGNPLFVEQLLSMLIDDGVLRRDSSGAWSASADVTTFEVPATISALLAARLDRLADDQRAILDTGSVTGLIFYEAAVRELCPDALRDRIPANLTVLMRKQLIRPGVGALLASERAFRFSHVLIRDSAYQRLLKRTRADLHERFAGWLERVLALRASEYEELVGYHLEQASRYRAELGPSDEHTTALALRASLRLASAGAKATARGDMPAAANLLERAMALRPERDVVRLELAVELAEAFRITGQFQRAATVVTAALEGARTVGDPRLLISLRLAELLLERSTRPDWAEMAMRDVGRAIEIFEQAGDHLGLVRAWRMLGTLHGTACHYRAAQQASEEALEHARLAGDRGQERRSLPALAQCALFGPEEVESAIARCEQLAVQAEGDRRAQSTIRVILSLLLAMHGDIDRARDVCQKAHATLHDLGGRVYAAAAALYAARIEMLAGDAAAADAVLRPDYEALTEMRERGYLPSAAAVLAASAYARDRFADAEELTAICEKIASPTDVDAQYRWRCVRAKLLARSGAMSAGVELAREALRLVLATDSPARQADVFADLAAVLELAGDAAAAVEARARAVELYRSKGDLASVRLLRPPAQSPARGRSTALMP